MFADNLKTSFEDTKRFGDVNIVSSDKFLSDVIITGKIVESNGEDLIYKYQLLIQQAKSLSIINNIHTEQTNTFLET